TRAAGAEPARGRRGLLRRVLLGRDANVGQGPRRSGFGVRGAGRAGRCDAAAALRAGAHGSALRGPARRAPPGGAPATRRGGRRARTADWRLVDALSPFGRIRIEDDVVVRENGLRNLTRESLPQGGGTLD